MLGMYLLVLKVSLVISVRMGSEIIYHLTYLVLTYNKSCISYLLAGTAFPHSTENVQGTEQALSKTDTRQRNGVDYDWSRNHNCDLFYFLVDLIFLKALFFRKVLGLQHSWEEGRRDLLYTPCPNACISSPVINITHPNSIFVTKDEPYIS